MMSRASLLLVLATVAAAGAAPQQTGPADSARNRDTRPIRYAEAQPAIERLAPDLAARFASLTGPERETEWRMWLSRRDTEIRGRVARGDEDSLVNLMLFGTSFTSLPRAVNDSSRLGGPDRAAAIVRGRIDDLVRALASPSDERLQFARDVIARRGIDPATGEGRDQAGAFIVATMTRTAGEAAAYKRELDTARAQGRGELAARSTLYRERGLSSDTSIRPGFAVDRTLEALRDRGLLAAGSVRAVAIVGPGLDVIDKAEGFDFYPQQTMQPFLVADSLVRLRLAQREHLTVTTIDLSPRVNGHLRAAVQRAADGAGYTVVLPRDRDDPWTRELTGYWRLAGDTIAADAAAAAARAVAPPAGVDVRTIRVAPDLVRSVRVLDLNVVVERLDAPPAEPFDLVIATNVLVYYDVVEQSLALANIAAMLRPGGMLLSNDVLVELPTTPIRSIGHTDAIYSDRPDDRDQVVWYQRLP